MILALRYLGQRKPEAPSEEKSGELVQMLASSPGVKVQPVSDKTRELIAHAEETLAKLRKGTNGRKS